MIRAACWAAILGLGCFVAPAAASPAREVTVSAPKMKGFGRIVLSFDRPAKVQVKVTGTIAVIGFGEPVRIVSERLSVELPGYVSAVRRDPDGTGLRLALRAPARANVIEAGERVFIDLLPEGWTGMPPPLPTEVVNALAERARVAEERLKAAETAPPPPPKRVRLQVAQLPRLTRLVFEVPPDLAVETKAAAGKVDLAFGGSAVLDEAGARPRLAPGVLGFEVRAEPRSLAVTVKAADGFAAQAFREGDTVVVDLALPPEASPPASGAPRAAKGANARPPSPAPPSLDEEKPAASPPQKSAESAPPAAPRAGLPAAPDLPPEIVAARLEMQPEGPSLLFPFRQPTPAAAFERGGILTLLFETGDQVEAAALGEGTPLRPEEIVSRDRLFLLRLRSPQPGSHRLVPDGTGWRLASGTAELPPDAVQVSRVADENGRDAVSVALPGAAKAHWLRDADGSRLAVVTATGRAQALPLPRSFVEFDLPATKHGLVVDARADDLAVSIAQSGVVITREVGLSLSRGMPGGQRDGSGSPLSGLVLPRDNGAADERGGVLRRYRDLLSEVAEAPRSGRAEARFRLARFLVTSGLNEEAAAVLALARGEDQVFARRRETLLLSAIAAIRAGRPGEARALLAAGPGEEDAEADLWRAVIEAGDRHWAAALKGFRRSTEILERYPDDIAGSVRLVILAAAIGTGDTRRVEREIAAIDRLPTGALPRDEHDLARAKADEAVGRTEEAFKGYERLVEEGGLRAGSEARLRAVLLGMRMGAIPPEAAISRLETLSLIWRSGETEIGTIDELARLYAEAGRWREMFEMARRASRLFPVHERSRDLHDRAGQVLESLLLDEKGEKLSAVQAVSLYFDFREFAPVGRRGDEIVRRLAERLVELDLLDQAAELLQYQMEKRLTGVARASVGARLAAIRLMNGTPLLALSALRSSRLADLPEEVRRFRFMLEAKAQADLSRTDLALEAIAEEPGPDFDRLRVSILWTARRWREAGEATEALLGTRWNGEGPLSDGDRAEVIRAAIAYAITEDAIARDRLRQKFGRKMLDSPDAKTFASFTSPGASTTPELRRLVQEISRADSLKLLLADWMARHAEKPERPASGTSAAPARSVDG